jgi:hypothetical protein
MTTGSQFRPPPPPALTSSTWTKDVNEIRELGSRTSTVRTAEQTNIGRFWFFVGPQTWSPILRQVAASKDMELVDCARLFALAAMASHAPSSPYLMQNMPTIFGVLSPRSAMPI